MTNQTKAIPPAVLVPGLNGNRPKPVNGKDPFTAAMASTGNQSSLPKYEPHTPNQNLARVHKLFNDWNFERGVEVAEAGIKELSKYGIEEILHAPFDLHSKRLSNLAPTERQACRFEAELMVAKAQCIMAAANEKNETPDVAQVGKLFAYAVRLCPDGLDSKTWAQDAAYWLMQASELHKASAEKHLRLAENGAPSNWKSAYEHSRDASRYFQKALHTLLLVNGDARQTDALLQMADEYMVKETKAATHLYNSDQIERLNVHHAQLHELRLENLERMLSACEAGSDRHYELLRIKSDLHVLAARLYLADVMFEYNHTNGSTHPHIGEWVQKLIGHLNQASEPYLSNKEFFAQLTEQLLGSFIPTDVVDKNVQFTDAISFVRLAGLFKSCGQFEDATALSASGISFVATHHWLTKEGVPNMLYNLLQSQRNDWNGELLGKARDYIPLSEIIAKPSVSSTDAPSA